jgi:hypothetical protein
MRGAPHSEFSALIRRLQHTLSLDQRGGPRVEPIKVQEVKGVVHHPVITSSLEVVLERSEIRTPIGVSRDDLAIDHELPGWQAAYVCGNCGKALCPVETCARVKRHAAVA